MYAFKSMCPPHFNMAGGGRGVKAILNEFSLPAKCELMIRSLTLSLQVQNERAPGKNRGFYNLGFHPLSRHVRTS